MRQSSSGASGSAAATPPAASADPFTTPLSRVVYWFFRGLSRIFCIVFFRAWGRHAEYVPATGPVLIVANHQSYIDPPLSGFFIKRHVHFVARVGLFSFGPMGRLLAMLNSIPIRDDEGDLAAIKEILRRLAAGHAVVIFPEGSRTEDGAMTPFKRGVALLMKRARCPVVPAAVEGCFDAWPRSRAFPRLWGCRVAVKYAPAISPDELLVDGADAALRRLQLQIDGLRLELRAELRARSNGRYPPPGLGDKPWVPPPETPRNSAAPGA